jgi:prepilin-type N-terminal cleavage/methylation domain-containing protein
MHKSFFYKNRAQAGFGLIELMVSISIVVLVLAVVMFNQGSSNSASLLRSQAYEVALGMREVQLSAVSAMYQSSGFRNVFGLYFNTTSSLNGFYYNFRDSGTPSNYFYTAGEEIGKRNNLDKRFEISEIRLVSGATKIPEADISILFERPNFDAIFYTAAGVPANAAVSAVEIDVRLKGTSGSGDSKVRTVEVSRTGQITVQ